MSGWNTGRSSGLIGPGSTIDACLTSPIGFSRSARIEAELGVPVAAVDQLVAAVGLRQHRRHEAAGHGVGVLAHLAGVDVEAVDVVDAAVAVRGEVDALAVAREDGVDVVGLVALHAAALAGSEVDREELSVVRRSPS
jgi:hypothetical protein